MQNEKVIYLFFKKLYINIFKIFHRTNFLKRNCLFRYDNFYLYWLWICFSWNWGCCI